jgi:hypothetical protein
MGEHLAQQTTTISAPAWPAAEARRQAVLKFGAAVAIREDYHTELNLVFLETFWQDLRYAVGMLLSCPGFSLNAIATMALGVGATTAIDSVIDATMPVDPIVALRGA